MTSITDFYTAYAPNDPLEQMFQSCEYYMQQPDFVKKLQAGAYQVVSERATPAQRIAFTLFCQALLHDETLLIEIASGASKGDYTKALDGVRSYYPIARMRAASPLPEDEADAQFGHYAAQMRRLNAAVDSEEYIREMEEAVFTHHVDPNLLSMNHNTFLHELAMQPTAAVLANPDYYKDLLRRLIEHGALMEFPEEWETEPVIFLAAGLYHMDMVEWLAEFGANLDLEANAPNLIYMLHMSAEIITDELEAGLPGINDPYDGPDLLSPQQAAARHLRITRFAQAYGLPVNPAFHGEMASGAAAEAIEKFIRPLMDNPYDGDDGPLPPALRR